MAVFVGGEDGSVPMTVSHAGSEQGAVKRRETPLLHLSRRPGDAPSSPSVTLPSRRPATSPGSKQVVACLDIRAMARRPLTEPDVSLVQAVALRRLQRAIRPGDHVCLSGGSRLAVCFGPVAEGVDASRLGERLAGALGDRLTLGEESVDLYVSVGVATGPTEAEQSDLIAVALRQLRRPADGTDGATAGKSRAGGEIQGARPVGGPPPPSTLGDESAHSGNGASPNGALPLGIVQRPSPQFADLGNSTVLADDPAFAGGPQILVVDTLPSAPGTPGVTANAVGACVGDLGFRADVHAPRGSDDLFGSDEQGRTPRPLLALLVVHPSAQAPQDADASREWEQPATLCRSYRQAGLTVVAISIGASCAALAGCIEQGAIGVVDIEDLPSHGAELFKHLNNGEVEVDATVSRTSWSRSRRVDPSRFEALMQLTPSEKKVLYHLTTGASASQIAGLLVVSIATVRSHIRSILRKLDVGSQLAAVAIARGEHPGTPVAQ
ncbi:MAG TPA: LuxR C-terminal-related transcriptional regulator [Acidimicrobiales bacterium]|nr:LuxR C-terminal-related transcriptional regulator [Acidimicrobiales bacterium]